jgi:CubicO group peptidase (beta-lactamase class C family)
MKDFIARYKIYLIEIGLAIIFIVILGFVLNQRQPAVVYPEQDWQIGTLEEHGFDSAAMAKGLVRMQENGIPIHSLKIIRHGLELVDATFYPYDGTYYHDLASVSKSLMTTLIGIAIDQGKLDLDQPMVSFFPDRTIANRDELKEAITVRHLVSMSSGLECTADGGERTQAEMVASQDWVQFALDLPVVYEPGTHFDYCSPGMHLLSAILQEATGMTAEEFARTNLFEPLGIQEVFWPADPQGYNHGWGDAAFFPDDMARLGYLFLHHGRWADLQVVSKQWVDQATRMQVETGSYSDNDYGFGWWVSPPGSEPVFYSADGRRGQRILVIPEWDMMVITTGGGFEFPEIEKYLVAAIKDLENPLPANPEGEKQLKSALEKVTQPLAVETVAPLPEIATKISGKTIAFESNPLNLHYVRMDFDQPDSATFTMLVGHEAEPRVTKVGLDNLYRNSIAGRPAIARGGWHEDGTFVIEYSEGPGLNTYQMSIRPMEDHIEFDINIPGIAGRPIVGIVDE